MMTRAIYLPSFQNFKGYPSYLLAITIQETLKRDKKGFHIWKKKTIVIQEDFQVGKYFHNVNCWILLLLKGGFS
jgi:hypothetical protein